MAKKINKKEKAKMHDELKDFEIKINALGEMETNYSIDKLNKFLDEKLGKERKMRNNTTKNGAE